MYLDSGDSGALRTLAQPPDIPTCLSIVPCIVRKKQSIQICGKERLPVKLKAGHDGCAKVAYVSVIEPKMILLRTPLS